MSTRTWNDIFEELPWVNKNEITDYEVNTLLKLNGHSISKTGVFTLEDWEKNIKHINENIDYDDNKQYNILEIGCGAGALLKYYDNSNNKLFGIDPSIEYYNIIKKSIPNGNFLHGDTLIMDKFNSKFNIILLHSCVQYFDNIEYFTKCINKIYDFMESGSKLSLTELIDKDLSEEFLKYRIAEIGEEKYNELYEKNNLYHFSISKNELLEILKNKFNNITFTKCIKRGNENKFYRFNCFCNKI